MRRLRGRLGWGLKVELICYWAFDLSWWWYTFQAHSKVNMLLENMMDA